MFISLLAAGLVQTLDVDGTEESRSAGLYVLGQLQVLHCVPCCLCLVKSACVELCVLLSSSGLSLSVYIYILVQDRLLHPAEWCKVDGTPESRSAGLHVLGQCSASVPFCGLLCFQVFACQECCRALCSSVIKWSLSLYIYICLVQDRLLHPADGPKLMAKTHTGLLACMCLVMFAWSRVHGAKLMAMTHTGLLACMCLDVFAWSRVNL